MAARETSLLVYMCVYVCMMGVRMEPITGTGGGSMDGTLVFFLKKYMYFFFYRFLRFKMVLIVEIHCDSRVDHARSFVFLGIFESYVPPYWILRFNSIGSSGTGAKYKLLFGNVVFYYMA